MKKLSLKIKKVARYRILNNARRLAIALALRRMVGIKARTLARRITNVQVRTGHNLPCLLTFNRGKFECKSCFLIIN